MIDDLNFSRLVVGTAQFGMPYGIANRTGRPDFKEVCRILECAITGGATTLDTAAAYGESEAVLGRALVELGIREQVTVITKVLPLRHMPHPPTAQSAANWIADSVTTSLANLKLDALPLCLFHDPADLIYMDALLRLREQGLVRHIGVSVITPSQVGLALRTPGIEAIQVAMSMLDQRPIRQGWIEQAARAGMAVFARSVYLQGLLLMPEGEIAPPLRAVLPARRALERICTRSGLTMTEMALRYALSISGITGVLTGVERAEQMAANVAFAARGPLPTTLMQAIEEAVPDLPETILEPRHWPGAAQ